MRERWEVLRRRISGSAQKEMPMRSSALTPAAVLAGLLRCRNPGADPRRRDVQAAAALPGPVRRNGRPVIAHARRASSSACTSPHPPPAAARSLSTYSAPDRPACRDSSGRPLSPRMDTRISVVEGIRSMSSPPHRRVYRAIDHLYRSSSRQQNMRVSAGRSRTNVMSRQGNR